MRSTGHIRNIMFDKGIGKKLVENDMYDRELLDSSIQQPLGVSRIPYFAGNLGNAPEMIASITEIFPNAPDVLSTTITYSDATLILSKPPIFVSRHLPLRMTMWIISNRYPSHISYQHLCKMDASPKLHIRSGRIYQSYPYTV